MTELWFWSLQLRVLLGALFVSIFCSYFSRPPVRSHPWRRERLLTPVFWPGEFHGLYSPWGCKESDTTERLSLHFHRKRKIDGNRGVLES